MVAGGTDIGVQEPRLEAPHEVGALSARGLLDSGQRTIMRPPGVYMHCQSDALGTEQRACPGCPSA